MTYEDRDLPCPRCGANLVRYEQRDKWRCPACRGALVGAGQLEVEIGELAKSVIDDPADPARMALHPCPICAYPMTPYTIGSGQTGIELDRCVDDTLVWFDHAEIGKVRALPEPEPPSLLTNTAKFLAELRAQIRTERDDQRDDQCDDQRDDQP
jgi:Zn-finger nucleic acid-binding protein